MRHIPRPKIRTQFLIFNLFGDYVHSLGAAVPTSGLLKVLGVLGVSERAARSTLSRMKARGWLRAHRVGRNSLYELTEPGQVLIEEGGRRIFGIRPRKWDQRWHIVIYSLPKSMRAMRRKFRARLSWLGYGMLLPGTMVSARSRREEILARIRDLEIQPFVHFFTSARLELADHRQIVARCWDLPSLNAKYAEFIERYQPRFCQFKERYQHEGCLPPEESFVQRFWMTYEFSAFPLGDPHLPYELLPPDWQGDEAAQLLADFRTLLREPSEAYIDSCLDLVRSEQTAVREEVLVEELSR